jgi:hypothetical protein
MHRTQQEKIREKRVNKRQKSIFFPSLPCKLIVLVVVVCVHSSRDTYIKKENNITKERERIVESSNTYTQQPRL